MKSFKTMFAFLSVLLLFSAQSMQAMKSPVKAKVLNAEARKPQDLRVEISRMNLAINGLAKYQDPIAREADRARFEPERDGYINALVPLIKVEISRLELEIANLAQDDTEVAVASKKKIQAELKQYSRELAKLVKTAPLLRQGFEGQAAEEVKVVAAEQEERKVSADSVADQAVAEKPAAQAETQAVAAAPAEQVVVEQPAAQEAALAQEAASATAQVATETPAQATAQTESVAAPAQAEQKAEGAAQAEAATASVAASASASADAKRAANLDQFKASAEEKVKKAQAARDGIMPVAQPVKAQASFVAEVKAFVRADLEKAKLAALKAEGSKAKALNKDEKNAIELIVNGLNFDALFEQAHKHDAYNASVKGFSKFNLWARFKHRAAIKNAVSADRKALETAAHDVINSLNGASTLSVVKLADYAEHANKGKFARLFSGVTYRNVSGRKIALASLFVVLASAYTYAQSGR